MPCKLTAAIVVVAAVAGAAVGQETPAPLRHFPPRLTDPPLTADTLGAGPGARMVVPPATYALALYGDLKLEGFIFQGGEALLHTYGGDKYGNTALGLGAAVSLTPGAGGPTYGRDNTAIGNRALYTNATSWRTTAIGTRALRDGYGALSTAVGWEALKTGGFQSTAVGAGAMGMASGVPGGNVAVGAFAGQKLGHGYSTAVGISALGNTSSGSFNIGLGASAGSTIEASPPMGSTSSFSHNIMIGNFGRIEDEHTVRIGSSFYTYMGAAGGQNRTFVAGIRDSAGAATQDVCIENDTDPEKDHRLIPCPAASSRRFKRDIEPLEEERAHAVLELEPVRFRYKDTLPGAASGLQYGLIAEEVAEVLPALVEHDREGRPRSVRYELLTSLLIRELQRQQRQIDDQGRQLAALEERLGGGGIETVGGDN